MSGEQSVFEDAPAEAFGARGPDAAGCPPDAAGGPPDAAGAPPDAAGGAPGEPVAGDPEAAAAPPERPESELEQVRAERDEYLDALRRLQADFDNFRKRTIRQQTELLERASESLCVRLLPVLDALDLAGAHVETTGAGGELSAALTQIGALLREVLAKEGLERIDAVGVPFDPHLHEAVVHEPETPGGAETAGARGAGGTQGEGGVPADADGAVADAGAMPDTHGGAASSPAVVVEVMRPGYRLRRKVLRPAMVRVRG